MGTSLKLNKLRTLHYCTMLDEIIITLGETCIQFKMKKHYIKTWRKKKSLICVYIYMDMLACSSEALFNPMCYVFWLQIYLKLYERKIERLRQSARRKKKNNF